jgi:acyl-CoA reductase-like NAD-dependent aldehyde dehydrogenase
MNFYAPQIGEPYTFSGEELLIKNPFDGEIVGNVLLANENAVEKAIQNAQNAGKALQEMSSAEKSAGLNAIAAALETQKETFAGRLSLEAAKPLLYAQAEVGRAIQCFKLAASYCGLLEGSQMKLDLTPAGHKKEGWIKRFPIGLMAGISPFNFPLNLAVHKIAPALAAACPIVLKPASSTPLSALALGELIESLNVFPKGSLCIVPCNRKIGEILVRDSGPAMLSFTGSDLVGWQLKALAGKKRVALELGGNAAVLLSETADIQQFLSHAESACFGYQGQVCIHAQRIFVHKSHYKTVIDGLENIASKLEVAHPAHTETRYSSMIDENQAQRVYQWAQEAIQSGAKPILMSKPEGTALRPILLTNTESGMKVNAEEAFGPLITVESISEFSEGIHRINQSRFGLQASVYTSLISEMDLAFNNIHCGGLILNAPPSFRVDHMPYGGEKDSGLGREGIRFAMEEMTYPKILVKSF